MIPPTFVPLTALPLTANGKLDTRALPPATVAPRDDGIPYVTPRTPTETLVAAVWKNVLRVERVGAHDNFFYLGGHSLLGTQAVARIERLVGLPLPLRQLFVHPTLETFSRAVDRASASAPATDRRGDGAWAADHEEGEL
jgi:hypothetical protein